MKMPKSLDDAFGSVVAYLYSGCVPPPTVAVYLNTKQLRETNISEDHVSKIEAVLESPSGQTYTLGYYPIMKLVEISAKAKEWIMEPTLYNRALDDQEIIILRNRLGDVVEMGNIIDTSSTYYSFCKTGITTMRNEAAGINLPWLLTQSQFADCVDYCVGDESHEPIFILNEVIAIYKNLPKEVTAQMNIPRNQLSNYGFLSRTCQKILKPVGP